MLCIMTAEGWKPLGKVKATPPQTEMPEYSEVQEKTRAVLAGRNDGFARKYPLTAGRFSQHLGEYITRGRRVLLERGIHL